MMNFIMLVVAIYVALVGASITVMMLALSKWYINKCKNMTKQMIDEFDEEM